MTPPSLTAELDYSTGGGGRRPLLDLPLAAALIAIAGTFTFLTMVVIPRFEMIFKDFGVRLPTATQVMLDVGRFVSNEYGWVPIWAIALGLPFATARLRPWPRRAGRRPPWVFSLLLAVFAIGAMIALCVIALYLPMIELQQMVNGLSK